MARINSIILKILFFLFALVLLAIAKPHFGSIAQPAIAQTPNSNIVNAYLVIPSDWRGRISQDTENRYKQNIFKGLEESRRFYSSKLNGHTFDYNINIETIISKPIESIDRKSITCVGNIVHQLALDPKKFAYPVGGFTATLFVIGSSNMTDCADTFSGDSNTGGLAYFSHQLIEDLGSSNYDTQRVAVGILSHELGHTFGLVMAGWARAHPCSITSKSECLDIPGLGTSLPYPPASEYTGSIMGVGAYDYPNANLNNTVPNPEIQKILKSYFINPNGDPAPSPIEPPKFSGKITSVLPAIITVGKDDFRIVGSGFGDFGQLEFYNPNVRFIGGYEIKKWTESEIVIFFRDFAYNYPVSFELAVLTKSGLRLTYPQVVIQPAFNINPTPSPTPTPILPSIIKLSPNPVMVGQELRITGKDFGNDISSIDLTDPTGFLYGLQMQNLSWTNSEVKLVILKNPYNYPTKWRIRLSTRWGSSYSSELLTILPPETSFPSPSASLNPSSSANPTITPSQSSTPTPTPYPTSSPSSITQIRISNYEDFRLDNAPGDSGNTTQTFTCQSQCQVNWNKSTLNPNGILWMVQMNPDGSNGAGAGVNLFNGEVYQFGNFIIQAKVVKKIVKIKFGDKETTSDFTQKIRLRLPGVEGQANSFPVPIIITYSDGSTKSLFFSFNYRPQIVVTPTPTPSSVGCIGSGVPFSVHNDNKEEWGSSCINGIDKGRATAVPGTCGCTVAQCLQYNNGPYCWVNNGQVFNDPIGCAGKGAALPASCFSGLPATTVSTPQPTASACTPVQISPCNPVCDGTPATCGQPTTCVDSCGTTYQGRCDDC